MALDTTNTVIPPADPHTPPAYPRETREQRRERYQRLQDEAYNEFLYWQRRLRQLDGEDVDTTEGEDAK